MLKRQTTFVKASPSSTKATGFATKASANPNPKSRKVRWDYIPEVGPHLFGFRGNKTIFLFFSFFCFFSGKLSSQISSAACTGSLAPTRSLRSPPTQPSSKRLVPLPTLKSRHSRTDLSSFKLQDILSLHPWKVSSVNRLFGLFGAFQAPISSCSHSIFSHRRPILGQFEVAESENGGHFGIESHLHPQNPS